MVCRFCVALRGKLARDMMTVQYAVKPFKKGATFAMNTVVLLFY